MSSLLRRIAGLALCAALVPACQSSSPAEGKGGSAAAPAAAPASATGGGAGEAPSAVQPASAQAGAQAAAPAAPAAPGTAAAAAPAAGGAAKGRTLYAVYCLRCHGSDGKGNGPMAAIYGNVGNLSDPAVHQRLPTAAMQELVKNGKGKMPAFGPVFSPEQLADVVTFAQMLRK